MKYYFLHIPKTGGVSLYNSVLYKPFNRDRIITNPIYSELFQKLERDCYLEKTNIGQIIKRCNIKDFDLMAVHTGYGVH